MPDHIYTLPDQIVTVDGLRVTWATISIASAGTTTVVTGVSGQFIDILGIEYLSNGTNTIMLRDTGGKMLLASQTWTTTTGAIRDLRADPWFQGDSGNGFAIYCSTGNQLSGGVWYTQG